VEFTLIRNLRIGTMRTTAMSTRRDFRAMTREALKANPAAVLSCCEILERKILECKILGGLLLLSAP
jgi:hypothetical protein